MKPLPIADDQHASEQFGDGRMVAADEPGNGGEVRLAVARDGVEQHVLAAQRLDVAAAYDALAVGKQHDLEHHRGVVPRSPNGIVLEARIEAFEADLFIDEHAQGVLEAAGEDLRGGVDCDESQRPIDRFVAGHCEAPPRRCAMRTSCDARASVARLK